MTTESVFGAALGFVLCSGLSVSGVAGLVVLSARSDAPSAEPPATVVPAEAVATDALATEAVEPVPPPKAIVQKYQSTCSPCHGDEGRGDGIAGSALTPPPTDFSDLAFWDARDDAQVKMAIKEGGVAVGKSPIMAPFGNSFAADSEIDQMVAYLKTFR